MVSGALFLYLWRMTVIAWLIYVPLQLAWLPLSILGAVWVGYKQILVSRRLGLSQTAIEIINGRWTGDVFGLRPDPGSRRLARHLPNTSTAGLALCLFPLLVARWIAGRPMLYPLRPADEAAGLANLVFSRSPRFDQLIEAHRARVEQVVILGAGLDTRAYGPLAATGLSLFELDQPTEQRAKRAALSRAGISSDHVCFVEVDFAAGEWSGALLHSGFDPARPTLFLWEGVTLYLSDADIARTLKTLHLLSAPGSVLLLDLYATRFLALARKGAMAAVLEQTGEGVAFGLDLSSDAPACLDRFAAAHGLRVDAAYFLGSAHRQGPFAVIAALLFEPSGP